MWLAALLLSMGACSSSAERTWEKAGVSAATAEKDQSECLTAAGIERVPRAHAGTAAISGRDADFRGRDHPEYVTCMEGKGYTRANR